MDTTQTDKGVEIFEGEVVGYQVEAVIKTAMDELKSAADNHHISQRSALVLTTAAQNLIQALIAQGVEFVNID